MKYKRARPRQNHLVVSRFVHRIYFEEHDTAKYQDGFRIKKEVLAWCVENYGKLVEEWVFSVKSFKKSEVIFYFFTKEDAMAFKLRFG